MSNQTHYTDEPSRLRAFTDTGYTRVDGGGFVTCQMVEQTLDDLRRSSQQHRPEAVLVDLREIAGYESSCLEPAQRFLHEAASLGVSRIALVTTSSFVRTASRVAAGVAPVELRTFDHGPSAERWLAPPPTNVRAR